MSPALDQLAKGLQPPVDAQAVASDGTVARGLRLGRALPSLFGCLAGTAPECNVGSTDELQIIERAVLAVAVAEGDDVAVGHWAVSLLPDVAVFRHATAFDAQIDVAVTMYALGAHITLIVRSVAGLEAREAAGGNSFC